MTRLEIVILAVEDLARATAFYDRAFGWPVLVSAPVYVELDAGGAHVGLYERTGFGRNVGEVPPPGPPDTPSRTELYLRVDDLAATIARLEAAGARCTSPRQSRSWGDEAAYFLDPDGNVIAVATRG